MAKKRIIAVQVTDISPYEFEGTLAQIKSQIDSWLQSHGPEARIEWEPDYWPQYNDSPSPRFNLKIEREETDTEYSMRVAKEKEHKAALTERDRKEYERLKKQFGEK